MEIQTKLFTLRALTGEQSTDTFMMVNKSLSMDSERNCNALKIVDAFGKIHMNM